MNILETNIFFWAMFALGFAGRAFDIYSSRNFIYYGQTENNPWNRNQYGYFDLKKNLIFSAAWLGIGLIAKLILGNVAGIFYFVPFVVSTVTAIENLKKAKAKRLEQISFLRNLRALVERRASEDEFVQFFAPLLVNVTGGRVYYRLFGWIYEPGEDFELVLAINERLKNLAVKPEQEWFPK